MEWLDGTPPEVAALRDAHAAPAQLSLFLRHATWRRRMHAVAAWAAVREVARADAPSAPHTCPGTLDASKDMDGGVFSAPVPGHDGCTLVWRMSRFDMGGSDAVPTLEGIVTDADDTAAPGASVGKIGLRLEPHRVFVSGISSKSPRRRLMAAVLPVLLRWCVDSGRVPAAAPLELGAAGWLKHCAPTPDRLQLARYYARVWGMRGTHVDIWAIDGYDARKRGRDLDMTTTVGALLAHVDAQADPPTTTPT